LTSSWLRDRLDQAGCEYVLSVGPRTKVFGQGTVFAVPPKKPKATRSAIRPQPDRKPEPIGELTKRLRTDSIQTVTFRDGPDGGPVTSRFIFARVHAAHHWREDQRKWREGAEGASARGMADRGVARRARRANRLLGGLVAALVIIGWEAGRGRLLAAGDRRRHVAHQLRSRPRAVASRSGASSDVPHARLAAW
jgi:hypothetical protein